ncbi:hypothetical protein HNY73_017749 [Argiope bruennichi]|uniref:Integrase zinc-binding domain-containing protein n=1 Tax=Argiope bruennichi TaxID=94029 RepID=A0A8T0EBQ8_ARGBR|nr:hypothetical protein HNY73_017749 [Argiope bruennichi]
MHTDWICGEKVEQVVLPSSKRQEVMMAPDIPLAGHLGEKKTKERIKYFFYWPTMKEDIKRKSYKISPKNGENKL